MAIVPTVYSICHSAAFGASCASLPKRHGCNTVFQPHTNAEKAGVNKENKRFHQRFTHTFHATTIISAFVTGRCKKEMASNYERMKQAILILDGAGNIQERLASAYRTEVQYVDAKGLDKEMLYELENINDQLTKVEAEGDKDTIDMSAETLLDVEAQDLVNQMRNIYEFLATKEEK
jgi:hypothetical protein